MTWAEFKKKWHRYQGKESSAYQEHFNDLCRMLGHPTPVEADPSGNDFFCFQKGVIKDAELFDLRETSDASEPEFLEFSASVDGPWARYVECGDLSPLSPPDGLAGQAEPRSAAREKSDAPAPFRRRQVACAKRGQVRALQNRLYETDLSNSRIGWAIFGNVDLSEVTGLDTLVHNGTSIVGIDTLYPSKGEIPDQFLREAGVPEEIIDIARTIRAGPPIQWHSCFISYSTKDDDFARRLHARMRAANMRVWFAPEDLKGGKKLHDQLFEAIQLNERLLLVLSEHSIQSEWVMTEIRKARETEKMEKRRKLFPIRLTDFATLRDWTCFDADTGKDLAVELREYFIPDFSHWKDQDAFESAFARLQKDLKAADAKHQ